MIINVLSSSHSLSVVYLSYDLSDFCLIVYDIFCSMHICMKVRATHQFPMLNLYESFLVIFSVEKNYLCMTIVHRLSVAGCGIESNAKTFISAVSK